MPLPAVRSSSYRDGALSERAPTVEESRRHLRDPRACRVSPAETGWLQAHHRQASFKGHASAQARGREERHDRAFEARPTPGLVGIGHAEYFVNVRRGPVIDADETMHGLRIAVQLGIVVRILCSDGRGTSSMHRVLGSAFRLQSQGPMGRCSPATFDVHVTSSHHAFTSSANRVQPLFLGRLLSLKLLDLLRIA